MKLMSLLDALFKARMAAEMTSESSEGSALQRSLPSWNLLMTSRAIHLIPRQEEEFTGLKSTTDKSEEGVNVVGNLSINSLGYAGHLLVKSQEELEALKRYPGGMTEVLRQTGVAHVEDVTQ
jgi:ATP adenylyltransferase